MELNNGAEGGTDGVTVTALNSGGASGDAFNSVVGTPTITFDDEHALGRMAYKVVAAASAQQVVWTFSTIAEMWGRLYLWSSAAPSGATGLIRPTVGGAQAARIRYNADGTLTLADAGNAAELTTAGALPTGQWMRIEWHIVFVNTGATVELRTYNSADSTTPTENLSTASAAGMGVNCDAVQLGSFNSATWTGWMDGIQVNNVGWPGPITRRRSGLLMASSPAAVRAGRW